MFERIIALVLCHLLGDYVLQIDMIAKTKGESWYHLFVHSALYLFPFILFFGYDWRLAVIFSTHFVVDALKARYKLISYTTDQLAHYVAALVYVFWR